MKKILKIVCVSILVSLLVLISTDTIKAQTDLGLILSPPLLFESLDPGEVKITSIKLINNSDHSVSVLPEIYAIKSIGINGEVYIDSKLPEFKNWIKFNSERILLDSGAEFTFGFTLDIPASAKGGGYSFVFNFLGESNSVVLNQSNIQNVVRLNSVVLFNVNSEDVNNSGGRITDWGHEGDILGASHVFQLIFENDSNSVVLPTGIVTIRNMFDEIVDVTALEDHWVLPEELRQFDLQWHKTNTFGKYTATIDLYQDNVVIDTAVIEFWSFTGWGKFLLMLIILGGAGLLVGIGLSFWKIIMKGIKKK